MANNLRNLSKFTFFSEANFHSVRRQTYHVKLGYSKRATALDAAGLPKIQYTTFEVHSTKPTLNITATGIRLYTDMRREVSYDVFEDASDIPTLIDVETLPSQVLCIEHVEVLDLEPVTWCVSKVKYKNHTYILKKHVTPAQNRTFQAELEVYTCAITEIVSYCSLHWLYAQ